MATGVTVLEPPFAASEAAAERLRVQLDQLDPSDPSQLIDLLESQPQLGALASRLLDLLERAGGSKRHPARLAVRSTEGGLIFVDVDEIDWIDAAGKHCRLNAGGESYLLREPIGALEERLDPARFSRIHRSTIVNLGKIREIRPRAHGNHLVVLDGDVKLNLTRSARARLIELLLHDRPMPTSAPAPAPA